LASLIVYVVSFSVIFWPFFWFDMLGIMFPWEWF
jgi:hypothetical protein